MKIQNYAIIFIIIILPFSIVCKTTINEKIDTLNDETRINNAIDAATVDAVKTIIDLNNEFYNLYGDQMLNLTQPLAKEAIDTFFNTLSINNNLPFVKDDSLKTAYFSTYIPAIIVIAYDGFYVYSIEETAAGTEEYVLSSKIPYVYRDPDYPDYIIHFTLGNYIELYAPNGVLYKGEFKKDYIDQAKGEYNEIYGILSSLTLEALPQLTTDMSLIMYGLTRASAGSGITFPLPSYLTTMSTDTDSVPMTRDYSDIYNDAAHNTLTLDDDVSEFNIKRREVIISLITSTLNEKMNKHNRYADMMGVTYDFYLPEIKDSEWINSIDDISIMAFIQGIPVGTDSYYNNYALGSARIVRAERYYALTDGSGIYYHKKDCQDLIDGTKYDTAGEPKNVDAFLSKISAAKAGYYPCPKCRP